ncbi:MAG: gamma-glutamyl-gamma-aminobutyrate hydrolase family protein [Thermodesulfobacteriota bacterium]
MQPREMRMVAETYRTALYRRPACCILLAGMLVCAGLSAPQAGEVRQSPPSVGNASWLMVSLCPKSYSNGQRLFSLIKELSGDHNGTILHFSRVTPELVDAMQPDFVVLGPQGTPWCQYTGTDGVALQNFLRTVPFMAEQMNIPILGICGGHQAMAIAFGGKVGPIRGGQDDCMPYVRERQTGLVELTLTTPDPITRGMETRVQMSQSHYDEVKVLPPGFVVLASDKLSPMQIIRHPCRPVYGVQGHPERFRPESPHGAVLIRNFIEIARTHNQTMRHTFVKAGSAADQTPPQPVVSQAPASE